jgi:hypothetical protein
MNPHIWQLHAAVFDLAQAQAQAGRLRDFVVRYEDLGDQVEISLAMPPPVHEPVHEDAAAREPTAAPVDLPC